MAIKDELAIRLSGFNESLNEISANVTKIKDVLAALQDALASGTITTADLDAMINPVKAQLDDVAVSIANLANSVPTPPPPTDPL